jgi:aminopeptidase 2
VVKTDLESSPPSFSGESLTHLDITSDITTLTFNLHPTLSVTHLAISSSDLKTTSSLVLPLTALSIDKDQERGAVDLSSLPGGGLKAGMKGVKLWTRFEAELGGSMVGYYKSEGDLDESTGKKPM